MHRFDWRDAADDPGGIEFSYPPEDWVTLLLEVGFTITGHAAVQAPPSSRGVPSASYSWRPPSSST